MSVAPISSAQGPVSRSSVRQRPSLALAALVLLSAAGCAGAPSPLAPNAVFATFDAPPFLASSIALIDADDRPIPIVGEAAGTWLRRTVRGVIMDPDLPADVRAQCCGPDRLIRWSTGWQPDPDRADDARIAAAILLHEARHAEGYRHTCPDQRRDRTFDEGGAWAVHAAWLRHMGDAVTADSITASDIGCR